MRRYWLLGIAAVITAAIIWNVPQGMAQQRGQALPPLVNIQLLKGMTPEQVRAEMNKFRDGLGVRCRHCHVVEANDVTNYILEDKPEKQVARKMIQMVRMLNEQDFFKTGERKVDCFTCHRGMAKIPTAPPPAAAAPAARPAGQ